MSSQQQQQFCQGEKANHIMCAWDKQNQIILGHFQELFQGSVCFVVCRLDGRRRAQAGVKILKMAFIFAKL